MKLILASKSPRRKDVLEKHGYDFEIDVSDVDESVVKNDDINELIMELAKLKAEAVAKKHKDAIVIGADTLVAFEGEQIGQQKTDEDAEKTIRRLMGKTHEVCTGVCIINTANGKTLKDYEISSITLNDVSDDILKKYIETGVYKGKAGAYDIADPEFKDFIGNIEGSKDNIRGTPIKKIEKMIKEARGMKIIVCGSINFADEMIKAEKVLKAKGHEVIIPASINQYGIVNSEEADALKTNREKYIKEIKPNLTREHFNKILDGDAILVINVDKKGIKNYIGGATFSEIMLAFHGYKKIYFLNPIPKEPETFIDELETVSPIILNGDLEMLK